MGSRGQWARDLANGLGNPSPSPKIVNLISAWTRQEFGSDVTEAASYNPLATKFEHGVYTPYNSVGVKNYATRATGLEATVLTLRGNHAGYADIVRGIQTNDPERALAGMRQAPWGTNMQRVEQVYRSADVSIETLPNEDPAKWRENAPVGPQETPQETADQTPAQAVNSALQDSAVPLAVITGESITGDDVRWAVLSMAGGAALALGLLLVIVAVARGGIVSQIVNKVVP